jgi:hypothetical protein
LPLEGHWERQQTPLRSIGRRELRLVVAVLGALALAAIVLVVVAVGGGSSTAKAGCIDVTIASTTGGARARACGRDAERYCRQQLGASGREARAVRAACRRQEYPAPPPAATG